MRREDLEMLVSRVPEVDHAKLQVVLRTGAMISINTVVKFEPHFVVFRGREAGNTDEGRGFFVPYDEVCLLKWEKVLKLSDLTDLFKADEAAEKVVAASQPAKPLPMPVAANSTTPAPMSVQEPGEIARQNLLARIRAAKSMVEPKK